MATILSIIKLRRRREPWVVQYQHPHTKRQNQMFFETKQEAEDFCENLRLIKRTRAEAKGTALQRTYVR